MACLVIGCDAFFLLGNNMALLLSADADLDEGIFDIRLCEEGTVRLCRSNGSLIEQIFEVSAGEARRSARDLLQIHIVAQRLVGSMDLEDLLPALHVGTSHRDFAVEAARPQDRGVEDVDPVGRRHDDDPFIDTKAVHFHEQLVEGLFALVVGASQACTSASCDSVDLIYEYDAGRILFCFFKHVADAGRADTDKHLHKIGARNAEKGHLCLSCNSSCQKSFTCSGSALEKDTLGDTRADFSVLGGTAEEIDDLLQIRFFLVEAGDLLESHFLAGGKTGPALAEIHHLGIAAAHALTGHQIEEQETYAHHQEHGEHIGQECILCRNVMDNRHDICLARHLLYVCDHRGIQDLPVAFFPDHSGIACHIVFVRADLYPFYLLLLQFLCKLFLRIGCIS